MFNQNTSRVNIAVLCVSTDSLYSKIYKEENYDKVVLTSPMQVVDTRPMQVVDTRPMQVADTRSMQVADTRPMQGRRHPPDAGRRHPRDAVSPTPALCTSIIYVDGCLGWCSING